MKYCLVLLLLIPLAAASQHANEYISYTVKGSVSILENKKQAPLKIGRILNDSTTLTVGQGGSVTLICPASRTFILNKPGRYQLVRFKDSCKRVSNDLTWRYFSYVWTEFYAYSHDNPRRLSPGAVVRNENESYPDGINPGLDVINFADKNFTLSWETEGKVQPVLFSITDVVTKDVVYRDSTHTRSIPMSAFIDILKPGRSYQWSVTRRSGTTSSMRLLNYHTSEEVQRYADSLRLATMSEMMGEEPAAESFRTAYLLECNQYMPAAYAYYQKAALLDPGMPVYKARLKQFEEKFKLKKK